ncbi:hypothetical protein FA95DRAFT_255228 [Auriscalpium vulgare]|uniref:Uncharacterized protein n=1 Tax=Auriscalpium vulgare TaxID=40419 RepID=A0ACB8RKN0_9AGAM|nr:hypothetical protein FA95DRAFT_255228 [Auriscalpium vulgare]
MSSITTFTTPTSSSTPPPSSSATPDAPVPTGHRAQSGTSLYLYTAVGASTRRIQSDTSLNKLVHSNARRPPRRRRNNRHHLDGPTPAPARSGSHSSSHQRHLRRASAGRPSQGVGRLSRRGGETCGKQCGDWMGGSPGASHTFFVSSCSC